MSPEEFIAKWRGTTRTERSAAQEHFLDLCALLGVPKPGDVDRHGTEYTFEKSTRKIGDTAGFADVWKRHCFAWEYKGTRSNLVQAYAQLKQYADAFDNPPLLIVSDMQEVRVHTNFTNAIAQQHVISLAELRSVEARDVTAFSIRSGCCRSQRGRTSRHKRRPISPTSPCCCAGITTNVASRILLKRPDDFVPMLRELFRAMANRNGRFGMAAIPWFNGGLFDDDDVLPLGIVAV
jgi:hypothetical protein